MDLRRTIAVIAAKGTMLVCRLTKHGGTSLPGMLALKIDPRILSKLAKGKTVVFITGTNGKTTTTGMISHILKQAGIKLVYNNSGANLVSGVVTAFADAERVFGKCEATHAIIEVDEATVSVLANFLQPDIMLATNFSRDQLDRYGEVNTILNKIKSVIKKFPETKLVLNADDPLCASLGADMPNKTIYYGMEQGAVTSSTEQDVSAALHCPFCGEKYNIFYRVYGNLGGYECPKCGYKRPQTQIKCTLAKQLEATFSAVSFEIGNKSYDIKIAMPGLYNVYNALSATSCCSVLGIPMETVAPAFESYESRFGRMELIKAEDGKKIMVILAKNPAGFNQTIQYLTMAKNDSSLVFIINDNAQDGKDISWLWDVDFEKMESIEDSFSKIYASGLRAEDMAVRLKYAGVSTGKISIIKDFGGLVDAGLAAVPAGGTFFIVTSYTAMLMLRKMLQERYKLKEIWQ